MNLSTGMYRRLMKCSDSQGFFGILAIDHRDNLVAELQKHASEKITYADVVDFKREVNCYVSPTATAVLTDPDYGMAGILEGAVSGRVGLIAPLEVTDYTLHMSQRQPRLIPDWDVEKLVKAGFDAAKLLIFYHPEAADAQAKTDLVDQIIEQCQKLNLPLFLEPLSYSLDIQQPLENSERRQIVVETARHFSARGVTILKLEFPLDVKHEMDEQIWLEALEEVNSVSKVPWTLLSGGVSFDVFLRQAQLACQTGASGVMVGRAVWAEAVALKGEARTEFLRTTAKTRMETLLECSAQSWMNQYSVPKVNENWYQGDQF